jgi:hypothetical protein
MQVQQKSDGKCRGIPPIGQKQVRPMAGAPSFICGGRATLAEAQNENDCSPHQFPGVDRKACGPQNERSAVALPAVFPTWLFPRDGTPEF